MKILSMTATFGKLSHQTLTLEPDMNIIQAPNEWGKSTWCAFIVAMLYGIDTRQKNTATSLADKEHYAPWSGEPMSGRMEIDWNGRKITLERSTKGRVPFGEFRAYETETGLDIPELTAANCGIELLGIERNVFTQAGFIRLSDMPVVQNESLRRRLNNLVTTGDENSAGDTLGKQLRDLKNKVRHNKTGLLPQAEYERDQLRNQLQLREDLQLQTNQIQQRQVELEQTIRLLENHADTLRYQAAQQGAEKIMESQETCRRLEAEHTVLEAECQALPALQYASEKIRQGQELLAQRHQLLSASQELPSAPSVPDIPPQYQDVPPQQAIAEATADHQQYTSAKASQKQYARYPLLAGIGSMLLISILIVCCTIGGLSSTILAIGAPIIVLACAAMVAIFVGKSSKYKNIAEDLCKKYPGITPDNWIGYAQKFADLQTQYTQAHQAHQELCAAHNKQTDALNRNITQYSANIPLEETISYWEDIVQKHTDLNVKTRELQNAREHASVLASLATTAPEPAFADELTLSAPDTESQLQACRYEQRTLQIKLGQCIGQAETIGQEDILRARLDSVCRRINRLEAHYRALELAQDVLFQATTALQRRFAPRISKKTQELFARMTHQRYQKIALSDDLSINTSAENEDTLHSAMWRSDGTVDQLYLSLRLAVAGEVTPNAPLILDDALLRFDDSRLKTALQILQEESENKQVIVFSCQSREKDMTVGS